MQKRCFLHFFHHACRFIFDIWYIILPWQITDHVWILNDLLIFLWVVVLWLRKLMRTKFSALFLFKSYMKFAFCSLQKIFFSIGYFISHAVLRILVYLKCKFGRNLFKLQHSDIIQITHISHILNELLHTGCTYKQMLYYLEN